MNHPQGGDHLVVQGVDIHLPHRPPDHLIQNYGRPTKNQKWERTELPVFRPSDIEVFDGVEYDHEDVVTWDDASRQELIKISGTDPLEADSNGRQKKVEGVIADPDYYMDCLEAFRVQELDRVKNGHWIFINGKAYYLPGNFYLYLNYWPLTDGYAEFRYTDLELFYFWESVKASKNFLGIIYITMRGVGKSFILACIMYYAAIFRKNARTTIQSTSDDEAAKFFHDKVLIPASRLPNFLRPINKYKDGDITQNSTLEFSPPSRSGMNMRLYNKMKKDALYSLMQYSNASEIGADGGTWDVLGNDEIGKVPPATADVAKRQQINKFTVFRGNKKLGNEFLCSTVGEMQEGGALCYDIYRESNQAKLNANGSTNTGLVRFFRSALDATFFDEFGFPVVGDPTDPATIEYLKEKYAKGGVGARTFHERERESLSHDQKMLISYKQNNPFNEQEAFWIDAEKCIYNAEILLRQRELCENRTYTRRGDIIWKKVDEESIWVDNDINGAWEGSFFDFDKNMVQVNEGYQKTFSPKAGHKRVMAVDPYSVMNLADERTGSMGAAAVYNRYDINHPDYSDTIIADYLARPKDPFKFYEDMICGAFFFGCPIFFETNKSNVLDYFRQRGYKWGFDANPNDFIWERPRSTFTKDNQKESDGIYQTSGTIEHYTNSTALHIVEHGHKLKHLRVINDWVIFNPLKTKKFDLGVAASMSIVGAERKGVETLPKIDLSALFRTFDNTGQQSVGI